MSFIEVKNVTKKFDNEPVLKNINIDNIYFYILITKNEEKKNN